MLKVNVIGIGPGNPDLLTGEARQAIAESTILAGDKRMVGQFGSGKKVCPTIKLAELAEVAANADAEKDVLGILRVPAADVLGRCEDYQHAWKAAESGFCCFAI